MSRLSPVFARVRLALRVLVNPPVKAGRLLGSVEAQAQTPLPAPESACPPESIMSLDQCPLCGSGVRTRVGEFNRFVHFAQPPDEACLFADYSLCHACGSVFSAKRPVGPRYQWLFDHFEDTLGRSFSRQSRRGKAAISSGTLSHDDRQHLRRLAARGTFVSEHTHPSRKDYLPALLADRLDASRHVEILGGLLELKGRRVLEVRSRLGSIPAALQRLYDTDVSVMSIFEGQRFLINELYGISASSIDFDRFKPPADGPWDLIICNHMLTHAVRPSDMLATLRAHLTPGGFVYFYNEPDDAEILVGGKSLFNTLNAFHLQTFDGDALVRAVTANGFSPIFVTHYEGKILCLAQATDVSATWPRISPADLEARRTSYLHARDKAILMLPERERWRVGDEWPSAIDRTIKAGGAELSPGGKFRIRHADKVD